MSHKQKILLTYAEIVKIVERSIGKDFEVKDYVIKAASENPMGFLGEHMLLKVVDSDNKEVRYFLKKIPSTVPQHLQYAIETRAFYKEVELYRTLFEDLKLAQNLGETFRWRPDFYYSRGEELIVMEDLTSLGYRMYAERTLLDEEHIIVALNSVARMHAASIIFEEKFHRGEIGTKSDMYISKTNRKATIGEIYPHLTFETEASDIKGHIGNTFCEAGVTSESDVIDLLEGYTKGEKEIIKQKLADELRKMMTLARPSDKYKNVILHGDLWSNNLLFKYDKQGHPEHAMLIDYQLARFGPPAHDLVMLFYLTQTKQFREAHEEKLLKYYYNIFSQELSKYDLSSDELYPWKIFRKSYDDYMEYGAVTSVLYFQLILLPSDIAGKFLESTELFHKTMLVDRSEMIRECYLTDKLFRDRTIEALHEVIDNYILK